jgi:hypothetical protein
VPLSVPAPAVIGAGASLNLTRVAMAQIWQAGTKLATFQLTGGTLTCDRANAFRRIGNITLTEGMLVGGGTVVPTTARDLFAPFGNELYLFDGIQYWDGTQDFCQVGVLGTESTQIVDAGKSLVITVLGNDRAQAYSRAGFTDVYTIPPNTNVGTAILNLLQDAQVGFPQVFAFQPTVFTTPTTPVIAVPGDDRWALATKLADAAGCELSHDPVGTCVFLPVPNPANSQIAATYAEGPNCTINIVDRTLTRSKTANYYIRDGQGTGIIVPVRGIHADTDPNSPTYIGGSYGVVVDYATSPLYATQPMAQAAADTAFLLGQGSAETVIFTVVPKPDHDVDDVLAAARVRAGIPANTGYVVDSFTLGFGSGQLMALKTRAIASILAA